MIGPFSAGGSATEPEVDEGDAAFYEEHLIGGNYLQRNFAKMRLKTVVVAN